MKHRSLSLLPGAKTGRVIVKSRPFTRHGSGITYCTVECTMCGAVRDVEHTRLLDAAKGLISGCPACRKFQNITGRRFGRLVAEAFVGPASPREWGALWRFRCECGATCVRPKRSVDSGVTSSCGCLRREVAGSKSRTHGMSKHPLFSAYKSMIRRCEDSTCPYYSNYGGRGIRVDQSWRDSFPAFVRDIEETIGARPSRGYSLDRVNNNGNYCKDNVRWATRRQQTANRRVLVSYPIDGGSDRKYLAFETLVELKRWISQLDETLLCGPPEIPSAPPRL